MHIQDVEAVPSLIPLCVASPEGQDRLSMNFWRDHERVKLLGKGSYGSAVLFKSKRTAARYVVKEVDLSTLNQADARVAEQEAKILLALNNHPNIVACQSSWVEHNRLYIVMEFCSQGRDWDISST